MLRAFLTPFQGSTLRCFSTLRIKEDYGLVIEKGKEVAEATSAPPGEVGLVSGAPDDVLSRHVRIYSPARTASQQGQAKTIHNTAAPTWKIGFTTQPKWTNPLIGWTSTADSVEYVARASLVFNTRDEAIAFATKHGWSYEVDEPQEKRFLRNKRFAGYGDNFSIRRGGVPDLSTLPSNQPQQKEGKQESKANK